MASTASGLNSDPVIPSPPPPSQALHNSYGASAGGAFGGTPNNGAFGSGLGAVGMMTREGPLGSASAPIHMVSSEGGLKIQAWRTLRTLALGFLLLSGVGALIEDRGISKGTTVFYLFTFYNFM